MKYLLFAPLLVGCRTFPVPGDDPVTCIVIGSRCYDTTKIILYVAGLLICIVFIYFSGKRKPL